MSDHNHGTSGGVELSEERVRELADEAERGYEPKQLRTRSRRGRPPLGKEAASVFHVRLEPSLRDALEQRADEEATTPSEVARRALREFLSADPAEQNSPSGDSVQRREVAPNPSGGWDVRSPQSGGGSSHHTTQKEAIEKARYVLRDKGGGELRIKGRTPDDERARGQEVHMGSERRRYHVTKRDDGWEVKAEGAKRASALENRKAEAVERARQIAQNQRPSQVVIHKTDGTIQTERTYGDDLHPPKG